MTDEDWAIVLWFERYHNWLLGMPAIMSSPQTTELYRKRRWWRRRA